MSLFNKSMMLSAVLVAGSVFAGITGANAAADRHVTIDNKTDSALVHFYASNVNQNYWHDDLLGDETIDPNYHWRLNIDDGTGACMFDFKAVFDDGTSLVRRSVNVCKVGTFTYE